MRNNDIIFLNLHRRYLNQKIEYGGFLGIYILAAFINKNGYSAQSFAGGLIEGKKILDEVCGKQKVKMIGLYCDYENVTENIFLSKYVKENYNLPVIIGGPQATSLNYDFFLKSRCDAIVRYEGEITVLELMDLFLEGIGDVENILGIAYCKADRMFFNKDRQVIRDLDSIPFINDECYLVPETKYPGLSIMTGRGCPFNCAFCHEGHHTRQVRFRSVENVMEEIDIFLHSNSSKQVPFIMFTDDTFTLQSERVKAICAGLEERRKKKEFYWFCEGHIHTLYKHPKMIEYIANGGACCIQLGIESGIQSALDAYRKNTTVEEIKVVVKQCINAGVDVYGNIILAGAFYNEQAYQQNLKFAKELLSMGKGRVELGVVTFWPLPNTSMTMHPEYYGLRIIDRDFLTSLGDFPQVETDKMSRWNISKQMKSMERSLKEHMKYMLDNWMVPTEYILRWFRLNEEKIRAGLWYRFLIENKVLYSYYSLINSGEVVSSSELRGNIKDAHPMRVIEIYDNISENNDGEIVFYDCTLSSTECEVLLLTTGKLSVDEIVIYLRENEVMMDLSQVIELLMRLEKHHLIVWSEY